MLRGLLSLAGGIAGGAFPAIVNVGSIVQAGSVHTGSLPTSRVNGNLLIFYFKSRDTSNDPTVSAGWTQLDTFGFGGTSQRFGVFYAFVTGSEVAPTVTVAGGGTVVSLIVQYFGVNPATPVIAGSNNGAATGTAISTAAINSSKNNSLAISASWDDAAIAPTLPAGFTNEGVGFYQNVFGSLRLCEAQIAISGTNSGAVNCTQTGSVPWGELLFEMPSP